MSTAIDAIIMGQSYKLACKEGEELALKQAVAYLDECMCAIRDAGKIKARDRIAVLAALNLAFDQGESHAQRPALSKDVPDVPPATQERLTHLLHRLDHVLGKDGQLI
jgi:cell division protein ZapA